MTKQDQFRRKLEALINEFSLESGSNTPDFLLSDYLADCLLLFDKTLKAREMWYHPPKTAEDPQ